MTDRELLELAAKAAMIEILEWVDGEPMKREGDSYWMWNPITDDGDALRLAVSLGLIVEPGQAWVSKCGPVYGEDVLQGANAATRRAIVRAAAEIGKEMK